MSFILLTNRNGTARGYQAMALGGVFEDTLTRLRAEIEKIEREWPKDAVVYKTIAVRDFNRSLGDLQSQFVRHAGDMLRLPAIASFDAPTEAVTNLLNASVREFRYYLRTAMYEPPDSDNALMAAALQSGAPTITLVRLRVEALRYLRRMAINYDGLRDLKASIPGGLAGALLDGFIAIGRIVSNTKDFIVSLPGQVEEFAKGAAETVAQVERTMAMTKEVIKWSAIGGVAFMVWYYVLRKKKGARR